MRPMRLCGWLLRRLAGALPPLPDGGLFGGCGGGGVLSTRARVRGLGFAATSSQRGGGGMRGDRRCSRRGDRRGTLRGDGLADRPGPVSSEDVYIGAGGCSASLSASSASRMLADVSMDGHARPKTAREQPSAEASGIVHGTDTELAAWGDEAERPVAGSLAESMKEPWRELGIGLESVTAAVWSEGRGSAARGWKCALLCMHGSHCENGMGRVVLCSHARRPPLHFCMVAG